MKKVLTTGLLITCGAFVLSGSAFAQHREDSIEESWDRAAREKAQQEQQQDQYRWQTEQMQQQNNPVQPAPAPAQTAKRWPQLPPNPTANDYYNVNAALLDSLGNMYCVSTSYLRTLHNRNEAAKPTMSAPPPQPKAAKKENGGSFGYEKDSWDKDAPKQEPAPPPIPDRGTQELQTLNQELFQLLDKCLNR